MNSLKRHDGELDIDHRSSPGIDQELARLVGLEGVPMGEGTRNTVPTLGCIHCGGVVVLNPNRVRAREYCRTCDHYICDVCHVVRSEPDYKHRTINEIKEAVSSGKFVLAPGPISRAILIPTGASHV